MRQRIYDLLRSVYGYFQFLGHQEEIIERHLPKKRHFRNASIERPVPREMAEFYENTLIDTHRHHTMAVRVLNSYLYGK
ncbi:MAG: hypothetical protein H7832_15420 [Magnetococcus sp. DMHC-6]